MGARGISKAGVPARAAPSNRPAMITRRRWWTPLPWTSLWVDPRRFPSRTITSLALRRRPVNSPEELSEFYRCTRCFTLTPRQSKKSSIMSMTTGLWLWISLKEATRLDPKANPTHQLLSMGNPTRVLVSISTSHHHPRISNWRPGTDSLFVYLIPFFGFMFLLLKYHDWSFLKLIIFLFAAAKKIFNRFSGCCSLIGGSIYFRSCNILFS